MLKDLDFTVFTDKTMRLVGHEHTVLKQWSLFKGSLVAPYLTLLSLPILFFFFLLLLKYISTLFRHLAKERKRLPVLAVMSCRTNGRLVTIPEPRGRKSLETLKKVSYYPKSTVQLCKILD